MVEFKELTGSEAYARAMQDLSYPIGGWSNFLQLHPDRTYAYGDDGWALVLPGGLHFVDAECAHDINKVSGEFRIEKIGQQVNINVIL